MTPTDRAYLRLLGDVLTAQAFPEGALAMVEHTVRAVDPLIRTHGLDWPVAGYTMIGPRRLEHTRWCVETALRERVPGDLIETGVWRGGTIAWMRALLNVHGASGRTVWAADTFEGMPPTDRPGELDFSAHPFLRAPLAEVRANLRRLGLLDGVRFLPGLFADTLPAAPIERLAVLRLDGDLYASTLDALEALYPKVSPGGFVIVDDFHLWPGCQQAVRAYCARHEIVPDLYDVDSRGGETGGVAAAAQGAYWRVPAARRVWPGWRRPVEALR